MITLIQPSQECVLSANTNHVRHLSDTAIIRERSTLVTQIRETRHGDWLVFRAIAIAHSFVLVRLIASLGSRALATAIQTALQPTSCNRCAFSLCASDTSSSKPARSTARTSIPPRSAITSSKGLATDETLCIESSRTIFKTNHSADSSVV